MENDVEGGAPVGLHEALDGGAASRGGDVLDERVGAADGADGEDVDSDNEGSDRGVADGDLKPASRGRAEVQDGAGGGEEAVLGVELEKLEGSS